MAYLKPTQSKLLRGAQDSTLPDRGCGGVRMDARNVNIHKVRDFFPAPYACSSRRCASEESYAGSGFLIGVAQETSSDYTSQAGGGLASRRTTNFLRFVF